MANNKTASRLEKLQEENWRLKFQLDEELRTNFDSVERYVSHQRVEATKTGLKKTIKETELNYRRIDRQLHHVEQQLDLLSACLKSLREHARHGARDYDGALNKALELLGAQNCSDK